MLSSLQTIRAKLVFSFLLSMTIVSVVLGTFFWFEMEQARVMEIASYFERIKLETKEVSIHEKDFFSSDVFTSYFYQTHQSPHLKLHEERMKQLKMLLQNLYEYPELQLEDVQERIDLLIHEIGSFENEFLSIVNKVYQRGFQDYGLSGEMLECIRQLEDSPANIDLNLILMARRMEKDFFLRHKDSYIEKLDQLIAKVAADIRRKTSGSTQAALLSSLDCYRTRFNQMVAIDHEVGLHRKGGLRSQLSSRWEMILSQIDALETLITKRSQALKRKIKIAHAILLVAYLLLNLFSLYLLIRQLGRPIQKLSKSIRKVVANDFVQGVEVLKWTSKDEIGMLSDDVRKMHHKIREKTDEAEKQKEKLRNNYKKLELLSQLGKQVTSKLQVKDIVDFTYENINKLLDAPVFAIGKISADRYSLDYWYVEAQEKAFDLNNLLNNNKENNDDEDEDSRVKYGNQDLEDPTSFSAYCFTRKAKIFINDLENEYQQYLDDVNLLHEANKRHSLIFLPLLRDQKAIGVITVQSYRKNAYPEHHVNILETIATYVAVALVNAENFERIEAQAEEIQASEEELRQNHEELQSINDKMEEANTKMQLKNKELNILVDQLNRSKEIIEKKNLDITSSINYAQRIQEAVLPRISAIKESFPDSFLLFQPRDIVSGDFYWYSTKKNKAIIIAADCTGHGVPGALMSVIGYSILNETIKQDGIVSPDLILNDLHLNIRELLRQDTTNNRDGMDIAVCAVDLEPDEQGKRFIHFAGAKNNLYFVKEGDEGVTQIKGNIVPIGGIQKEDKRAFKAHKVLIDRPMTFYICSDGYQDQFGGPEGKKFMAKNLRRLLYDIHADPVDDQHLTLLQTISSWMGKKYPQLDDMLIFGAKIRP